MARVHGGSRLWIEGFHSTGWGGALEDTIDWLVPWIIGGANLYNPHAVYYSTAGGYFEWATPSTCWRQPYWGEYLAFAQIVARPCSAAADGIRLTDFAILYPSTTVMSQLTPTVAAADVFDAVAHPRADFAHSESDAMLREPLGRMVWRAPETGLLNAVGMSSTLVDEESGSKASDGVDGVLEVGGNEHHIFVLPGVAALTSVAARRLTSFVIGGGTLVVLGTVPAMRGGLLDDPTPVCELHVLIEEGHPKIKRYATVADFGEDIHSFSARVESMVPTMLRRTSTGALWLLVPATASQASRPLEGSNDLVEGFALDRSLYDKRRSISVVGRYRVFARDLSTGTSYQLASEIADGGTSFVVRFDSALVASVELQPVHVSLELVEEARLHESVCELPSEGWELRAVPIVADRWNDLGSDEDMLVPRALRYEGALADGS